MDPRKVRSLYEKVEKAVACCIAQTIDVSDLNVTKCCGALISTEYFALLVGNGTTTCPHCRGVLSDLFHLPWSKDFLDDLKKLRDELDVPTGGRPPMSDGWSQTEKPRNRTITLPMKMLESLFPHFTSFIGENGRCYLTGRELKMLTTLAKLTRNVLFDQNGCVSHVGELLYRFLYTQNASIFVFGHYADLFGKLEAAKELVISAALPQPLMRPRRIMEKRDTVTYAFLWLKPFMVQGRKDVVLSLRECFGLLGVELDVDPLKPHVARDNCNDCLKCKLANGIRQEIRHKYLNDTPKDYLMQCGQCGDVVDWRQMHHHVRKHKGKKFEYCHMCLTPISGLYASSKPHPVECPFRQFPIGPDADADHYRRPPMPLRMHTREKPDYPCVTDPVMVTVDVQDMRGNGKAVALFSWD